MTEPAAEDLSLSLPMAANLAASSMAALAASLAICVAASKEFFTSEAGSVLSVKAGDSSVVLVFLTLGRATAESVLVLESGTTVAVFLEFFFVVVEEFFELLFEFVELVPVVAGSVAVAAINMLRINRFIII